MTQNNPQLESFLHNNGNGSVSASVEAGKGGNGSLPASVEAGNGRHPSWAAGRAEQLARHLISHRLWLLALGHLLIFGAAYWLSFCLRFDFDIPWDMSLLFWASLPWVLLLKVAIFYLAGHYHGWWRYVTFADLASLLRASLLSALAIVVFDFAWHDFSLPRSIPLLDLAMTILLLGSLRCSWRLVREQFWPMLNHKNCRSAILVGADLSSGMLAHQIHSHSHLQYRIRAFLDVDKRKKGHRLGGIPILGGPDDVATVAAACRATDVLVTAGCLAGNQMRKLMEDCQREKLELKIIPPIEDLFRGTSTVPVRDIDINDLLRRDPVQLDCEAIGDVLKDRVVMVTGAGGSIGSEICRQALKFQPRLLVLVGKGEHSIFTIDRELQSLTATTELKPCIADVADQPRMRVLFETHRPDVVFHAAAHKHVPLMESNVGEAVKNNVFGTKCVADLADEYGAERFVLISTDKAVNPTSVMGATKQIAERYVHTLSQESDTRFVVVRFGNVLGSTGSVVPIFQEQIRRGGPITITDPRMTRYFMTIPEASQLVLQAGAMGRGGEIFVLEMGQPVRIIDLARDLIRLSGLPADSIELTVQGLRPGEKLFEELYFHDERTLETSHPKLRAAYHRPHALSEVRQAIDELAHLMHDPEGLLREKLKEIVPELCAPSTNGSHVRFSAPVRSS